MGTEKRVRMHLVAHTHWDREWYSPFEVYRARLLNLMDALLDILATEPAYVSFQLDGQTSMVEDYLELRPEKREEVEKLISTGRLLMGPWYTQPDEFLASGESLVRNLMRGIRMGREMGGFMTIGHLPDSFGHISQMPQILRGFGIRWALTGRGVRLEGDAGADRRFTWKSPDGSEVLAVCVGYGNGLRQSELPKDAAAEAEQARTVLMEWKANGGAGPVLIFHGTDHIQPKPGLPGLIAEANELLKDAEILHSTLPAYFSEVSGLGTRGTVTGELRDKRTGLLEGAISTRMDVKQENASAQSLLERKAEPLSVMAWMAGALYPEALLKQAWKYVLQNHAHDSICACGVDEVSADVLQRFRWAKEIGTCVVRGSLKYLAREPEVPGSAGSRTRLCVFNSLGFKRTGLVEAMIAFDSAMDVEDVRILAPGGKEIPHQLISRGQRNAFVIRPHITPRVIGILELKVAFIAEAVSSLGSVEYETVPVGKAGTSEPASPVNASVRGLHARIATMPNRLENEHLSVTIQPDGTLRVESKRTGQRYERLNYFEDSGEIGDVYNHVPPVEDRVSTNTGTSAGIALVENGPIRGVFEVETSIAGTSIIRSRISLSMGSERVDISTEVENRVADHRLRAIFPLGVPADSSRADGQFDVNTRKIKKPGMDQGEAARLADCHPMESFVDVEGKTRGLAILALGLPEYEASGNEDAVIALTLIRSVSKGPYNIPVPDAEMRGKHRFEYSIFPHAPGIQAWRLYHEALDRNVPFAAAQKGDAVPKGENPMNLFTVEPDELVLSAVKRSESGDALVTRLFNPGDAAVRGSLVFGAQIPSRAYLVDLNEETQGELEPARNGRISFPLKARGIATLKLVFT